ncbi:MAG: Fic family protein, partial [Candidatus Methanomethylophilaceae archaeon]|nr:Fic family protein [Candidatus Methanomethylophilaceae archaeon]
LYGDVFQWAGEYRTADYPDDPAACRTEYIGSCVDDIFKELKEKEFLSKSEDFCGDLAHVISELYAIRPFKLGNGITVKVLANCIAILNGKYLDYSEASESLLDVAIRMGVTGDISHLKEILSEITEDY